jgi:hypothetical protein
VRGFKIKAMFLEVANHLFNPNAEAISTEGGWGRGQISGEQP